MKYIKEIIIMDIGSLIGGVSLADNALNRVLSKKGTRLEKKIEAVGKLQKAINATESYLVSTNNKYLPNNDLSQMWVDAFAVMIPFDKELAKRLRNKSRFWSNPQSWLDHPGSMELIPTLKDLNEKCEEMIQTLQLRISKR